MVPDDAAAATLREQWAAETLRLSDAGVAEEITTALLTRVGIAEFRPAAELGDAFVVLTNGTLSAMAEWRVSAAIERRVRERIAEFVGRYFTIPPDERQREWAELAELVAPYPPLRRQLHELRRGLTFAVAEVESESAALIAVLQQHFLATPTAAARLRQRLQAEIRQDPATWERAAGIINYTHPEYARLSPAVIEWAYNDGEFYDSRVDSPGPLVRTETLPTSRLSLPRHVQQETANRGAGDGYGWVWWIVAVVVLNAFRLAGSFRDPPRVAPVSTPIIRNDPPANQEAMREIFRLLEERKQKTATTPPVDIDPLRQRKWSASPLSDFGPVPANFSPVDALPENPNIPPPPALPEP